VSPAHQISGKGLRTMNGFYKGLIQKTEAQKEKDAKKFKRESTLLEVQDERTIPKLRVRFKRKQQRKFKKRK
jgi:hypothetical protein